MDRALPGRIEGFYVVGSACLGGFRVGRSDLDFVAVISGDLARAELLRLRSLHITSWASALVKDAALRGRWPLVCNGLYLREADLSRSALEVTPIAAQVAGHFAVSSAAGFDVNPVTWHMLSHYGVALRGPAPQALRIRASDGELRAWTLDNLNGYWRRWAAVSRSAGSTAAKLATRRYAAWGVLGVPRLHYTLATGAIASKEVAGRHALDAFDACWHPLIDDSLAFWRGDRAGVPYRRHPQRRRCDAAHFVASVIDAANTRWPASQTP